MTQDNENNTGQNTGDSNKYLDPEPWPLIIMQKLL